MQTTLRDLSRKALLSLLVLCLLLIAVVGWVLADARRAAWTYAAGNSRNLVTALARDIERTVETYDLSLQSAIRAIDAPAFAQVDPMSRQQLLFDGAAEARNMGAMFVLNPAGKIIYELGALTPRSQAMADRDFFLAHRDRTDVGLFISKPYRSRSMGDWSIALSRRINGPDGQFAGVVVGSMRYSYFRTLFAQLDLGPDSGISLFGMDGTMLFRSFGGEAEIGRNLSDASLFRHLHDGASAPYEGISRADGQRRLFAFTRVGSLPMVLSVNTALTTVYADWTPKAVVVGGISLVLIVIGALLVRTALDQQTRRALAERETRRAAGMLKVYFENTSDAVFALDVGTDGSLRYAALNPAMAVLTGLTAAQAVGRQPADLFRPDVAQSIEQRYRNALAAPTSSAYTDTRPLPGGMRDLYTILFPIRGEDGAATHLLGCTRDMTEHNGRQAEHYQTSKMEAVGRLTAGVAHDFNNYLQTIVSSLDIMTADYLDSPDAQEIAGIAHKAADGAGRLIHHLLAFSRQQVLQPRRVNVTTLLSDARKLIGPSVRGLGVQVKVVVEPFTDDIQVDPGQAESCLLNLLMNACEAMPHGGSLVLHARNGSAGDARSGTVPAGQQVVIAVHDTGYGMDEATVARAFEPFFTTKSFGKGSGLGLSMAQGFCRQSGGDIRILKGGTVGTRVELWLPAATRDLAAAEERDVNLATIGRGTGRVLLVEDERDVSVALATVMVSGGFEVVTVNTASDGLLRLRDRDPYDAIVADSSLSDMAAPDFLTCVAALAPRLPLLLLTDYDPHDGAHPALANATHLLRRPVGKRALLHALRETIGERRIVLAA